MWPCYALLCPLLLVVIPLNASLLEIFVAPPTNNAIVARGTRDAPFTSLYQARDHIRDIKNLGKLNSGVNVYIRGGRYEMPAPLLLTTQDSGLDPARPISYSGYAEDKVLPVISGGLQINGWVKSPNNSNIWMCKVPQVVTNGYNPKQLWINGERRVRARLPSTDGLYYWNSTLSPKPTAWNNWGFVFYPSDIRHYYNLEDVIVVMFHAWTASHHEIAQIFKDNNTLIFKRPTASNSMSAYMNEANGASGHRYFVENVLEGLDEAGEWYLDRTTGVVSYYAFPGEDVSSAVSILSNLDMVVVLQGDSLVDKVQNIQLDSVLIEHNEWHCPPVPLPCDMQAADYLNTSAIYLVNAKNILIQNVTISHTGTFGVWIADQSSGVIVDGISTSDLGAGGVRIGRGYDVNTVGHVVQNCYILDGGNVFYEGIGVLVQQSSNNCIIHNEIGHLHYTGISVGWTWGYSHAPAQNNTVEFNHIYDIGKNTLSDMGGIYTLGVATVSRINNNIIHDVYSYNYGGWGLYPDEGSSQMAWTNNIVYNCKCSGLHQHYGENNTISNNIFAFVGWDDGAIRTDPQPNPNSLTFSRNIVYVSNATLFIEDWQYRTPGQSLPYNMFLFSSNVYFSQQNKYVFGDSLTFSQWQAVGPGQDRVSKLDDPLFVDALNFNFALQKSSPAFSLGFVPIDTSQVGPLTKLSRHTPSKQFSFN